jgi:hypothetical protein
MFDNDVDVLQICKVGANVHLDQGQWIRRCREHRNQITLPSRVSSHKMWSVFTCAFSIVNLGRYRGFLSDVDSGSKTLHT